MQCRICGQKGKARNLCSKHYQKYLRYERNGPLCLSCKERPIFSKQLCDPCYQLKQLYGRTHRIMRKKGTGHFTGIGYKRLPIDGKRVMEHRVIMEKHLGRKLKPDECVHHIDGNPSNNSIENLQLTTKGSHRTIHRTTYFDGEKKQCSRCKNILPVSSFGIRKERIKFADKYHPHCNPCRAEDTRKYRANLKRQSRHQGGQGLSSDFPSQA